MRVNSAFKVFFNHRLVVGSGIIMVMLAIFLMASSFTNRSDRAKQLNLIIRQIGHRLLLQAGDSTSRVLPVTEIGEGTFQLSFENEFVFNHDSLITLVQELLPKTQFLSGYTVTVHECNTANLVYGIRVNLLSPDVLSCQGRSQPSGCYTIEFAFPDLYENIEQKKAELKSADTGKPTEGLKPAKQLAEELNPVEVNLHEADSIPIATGAEEQTATTFGYPLINLVSSMLVLLSVALLIGRFGKNPAPVPVQGQDHAVIKESVPEMSALGKFLFDVRGQRLLLGSEVITLTDKECKVLELLDKNFGELIPRETLMQKVWINEGVITGRSLDVFVSKLRKKLSSDPELRISNVHGKGYKLEIAGIQVS